MREVNTIKLKGKAVGVAVSVRGAKAPGEFSASVTLTHDTAAEAPSAWISQEADKVPRTLGAKATASCEMGALLDSVVDAVEAMHGGQSGTTTTKEWNEALAHLLADCPYEKDFVQAVNKYLEAGGEVRGNKYIPGFCVDPHWLTIGEIHAVARRTPATS